MKNVRLILIVLLLCGISYAQDKKETKSDDLSILLRGNSVILDDGCGDPAVESQLYEDRKGKITKIVSSNKVIFEQTDVNGNKRKGKFVVELVGIDSSKNQVKVIDFLKKYVLNQNVEITGNLKSKSDKHFGGIIFVVSDDEGIDWINENLLELGIAKYKEFSSDNLVPFNKPCQMEKAQNRAKQAKLGIWSN